MSLLLGSGQSPSHELDAEKTDAVAECLYIRISLSVSEITRSSAIAKRTARRSDVGISK